MTNEPKTGRRQRILKTLGRVIVRHALLIVVLAVLGAVGSVVYTFMQLDFITDRNALVDPQAEYNRRFLEFKRAFGDQELMLIMVAPGDGPAENPDYDPPVPGEKTRGRMKAAAAEIATRLRAHPEEFPRVIDRVDPDSFGGTRMLYLPEDDLRAIRQQVEAGRPMIEEIASDPGFPSMLLGMRKGIEEGGLDAMPGDEELGRAGEEMAKLLRAVNANLEAERGEPPLDDIFVFEPSDPTMDEDGHFFMWGGRLLYIPVLPKKNPGALNQVEEPLRLAREIVGDVQEEYPELAIGLTGRPVIYSDEMAASGRDMTFATIFAVCAVGLMFVLAFRSFLRPMQAVLSLVLALCWTIGATTLLIGHLNIFAMVFGVVLVGLGIDFGIHMLAHYRHGLERGLSVTDTLHQVYEEIGMGTVIGAITTAAALSTAAFTDFMGLAELGIICGIGIVFCLVAMLIVFPAMLVVLDRRRVGEGDPVLRKTMRERELNDTRLVRGPARSHKSRIGALGVAVLVVAALGISVFELSTGWIPFDYNLLELNDPSAEGIHWERLLIDHDQRASYVVSTSHSLDELKEKRRKYEALKDEGLVRSTESILPENEESRREILARIGAALPDKFNDYDGPSETSELRRAARRLKSALLQLHTRGERFEQAFTPPARELDRMMTLIRDREAHVKVRLAETEPAFFDNLLKQMRDLRRDTNPPPVTVETLPAILRPRYVGMDADGRLLYALYVYPATNVWQREHSETFTQAAYEVDPDVTGVVVQIHESGSLIVEGFGRSVLYAFIAIVVLLLIDLRRPLAVIVALMPMFCALCILLGVMTLTDLSFNFANFFGVPILIGTTVDAGVYLVHSQRHGDTRRTLRQTRGACLLCGMTTLLGFGSLITASHLGVVSLGLVLVVGCIAGVLGSFFVVPVVLAWFNERGKRV